METSLACLFASCRHNCCTNIVCALCPRESWGCNAKPFLLSLSFLKTLFFLLLSSCRRGESLHAESINDHCIFTLYRYKVPMRSVFESRFRQSTKSLSSFAFSFEILLFFQQSKLQNFLSLVEYIYQSRDMIYRRVAWISMKSLNIGKPIANGEFLTVYRILDSQWR